MAVRRRVTCDRCQSGLEEHSLRSLGARRRQTPSYCSEYYIVLQSRATYSAYSGWVWDSTFLRNKDWGSTVLNSEVLLFPNMKCGQRMFNTSDENKDCSAVVIQKEKNTQIIIKIATKKDQFSHTFLSLLGRLVALQHMSTGLSSKIKSSKRV